MTIQIILFYKFTRIENPKKFKKELLNYCINLEVKGRIILANEGINGSISGTLHQVNSYKKWLSDQELFKGIEFKEETGLNHPFEKIVVKIKKEIIKFDKNVDLSKAGKHVGAEEFLEYYNNKNVLILDTRNNYESDVGKFKNAITPNISSFKEFPDFVKTLNIPKDTPILTYCTGGIRCEKASAYMIQEGFTNVGQLHGGIITFCQKLPNTVWEGSCFVFDKRLISNIEEKEGNLGKCIHCKIPCDLYRNCKYPMCNEFIFICLGCKEDYHSCCSNECKSRLLTCCIKK